MSSLEDLFSTESTTYEKKETPLLKFDWKTQTVRARFKTNPGQMKLQIFHYVKGVGYVGCGQKQGVLNKEDDKGNKIKVPVLWTKDRNKNVACKFCAERSALRNKYKEAAIKRGDKDMNKKESDEVSNLHKRTIGLFAEAETTVFEDGVVVDGTENQQKALMFNVIDLFMESQNKAYKQLQAIEKVLKSKKKEFKDYWYIINGQGQIQRDDEVTKDEKKTEINVDLSFLDERQKSYEEGLKLWNERQAKAEVAIPVDEEDEERVEPDSNKNDSSDDDDELAF